MVTLFKLQLEQKKHDKRYHEDIFHLTYQERMNHYVLHCAKYLGRFASPPEETPANIKMLTGTYVDTFIIGLAASDALNLNLDERMTKVFGISSTDVMGYASYVRKNPNSVEQMSGWSLQQMARPVGSMAKALESLDHLENFAYRQALTDGVVDLMRIVLIGSNHLSETAAFDLTKSTRARWREIEKRRLY